MQVIFSNCFEISIPYTCIQRNLIPLDKCVLNVAAKGKGSGGVKTAKLYAWVALQSLPEEMVISPCLLDFLEKALETIPITPIERNYTGNMGLLLFSYIPLCSLLAF